MAEELPGRRHPAPWAVAPATTAVPARSSLKGDERPGTARPRSQGRPPPGCSAPLPVPQAARAQQLQPGPSEPHRRKALGRCPEGRARPKPDPPLIRLACSQRSPRLASAFLTHGADECGLLRSGSSRPTARLPRRLARTSGSRRGRTPPAARQRRTLTEVVVERVVTAPSSTPAPWPPPWARPGCCGTCSRPVPAGISLPRITFSFRPTRLSDLPWIAASVRTLVVSWKEAADSHDSVASDALVIPISTGRPEAGVPPSATTCGSRAS